MMPPPKDVLANAIGVLSDQVLPQLAPTTWGAANVRACITLLTHVEDALADHGQAVIAQAQAMQTLLAALSASEEPWLDDALRRECAELSAATDAPSFEGNAARKTVLSRVVEQSDGKRSTAFDARLRACLFVLNDADYPTLERSTKLPPF